MGDHQTSWTDQRRANAAKKSRDMWGTPDGFSTIYGITVPIEHALVVRYFAGGIAGKFGVASAVGFVTKQRDEEYAEMPRLKELWEMRQLLWANKRAVRMFNREVMHNANKDRR